VFTFVYVCVFVLWSWLRVGQIRFVISGLKRIARPDLLWIAAAVMAAQWYWYVSCSLYHSCWLVLCELELVFDSVLYYSLAGKIYVTFEAWTANSKQKNYMISHIWRNHPISIFSICLCIFIFFNLNSRIVWGKKQIYCYLTVNVKESWIPLFFLPRARRCRITPRSTLHSHINLRC
jgi:hypothetical protein